MIFLWTIFSARKAGLISECEFFKVMVFLSFFLDGVIVIAVLTMIGDQL